MRRNLCLVAVVSLVLAVAHAGTRIKPTTTLTTETANNTSTADSFLAQSNGNLGPSNISKVDTRSLLYPGATTALYVHYMPWFGPSNHMNVGYSSNDPNQIRRQVDDMLSRGITGAIVDWYGPNKTWNNTTTLLLMAEAQLRNGQFTFAVTEDKGALQACANTSGCDISQQLITDLTYAYNTFELSPAYAQIDGRPLLFFFDVDRYTIDWPTVTASIPGNPLLIFGNSGGFTHSFTSGSYAWIIIDPANPNNWNASYLDNFYNAALKHSAAHAFATAYKGFNDTLASWGQSRIMNQNCGQTWLNTFQEIGKYYSSAQQLESLQIVTWNDYEEGSPLETGIETCVAVAGATTGDTLNWSITGQENTIDHYTVFISLDGENLMPLADVPAGTHNLDLAAYGFDPAAYTLYVKAVGRPSLKNQMSPPLSYTVADPAPTATLALTPLSGTAPLPVIATVNPSANTVATRIDFGDGIVATTTSAAHTYSVAGTYTVTATVTNASNLSGSATATVVVKANLPPIATLAVTPASGPAPMVVTASMAGTTDPDGTVNSCTIDFGDGTLVLANTASHTYTKAGTYAVKGTAVDNAGLSASATATVTVTAVSYAVTVLAPGAGATVNSPVAFLASTSSPYPVTGMKIYVDGVGMFTTAAANINTSLALKPGAHAVTVKAWNTTGAIASRQLTINVPDQPPVVSLALTPTSGVAPLAVTATVSARDSDGTINSTSINFGDGTIVSGAGASHTYRAAGTYTVTASATDNAGLATSARASITVTAPAPAPVSAVTMASPTNGGIYSPAVRVTAKATSSAPVIAMKVYVDSIAVYSIQGAALDVSLTLKAGTHRISVNAWDSSGAVLKSSVNITVQSLTATEQPTDPKVLDRNSLLTMGIVQL